MHMADALVSPVVGGAMLAVSAGAIVYSVIKTKDDLDEKKVPMMGVMGAFVFEAQMINFTIPATGSSGHIGGGILLSALLGPFPAFLTIKDMGSFVGQLLLRSIDRAERVFDAMKCRGFHGSCGFCEKQSIRLSDWLVMLFACGAFVLFRVVDISAALGNLLLR